MAHVNHSFWRKARAVFRGLRIVILSLVLILSLGVLWLNYVGVPGFVTSRIRAELQRRNFVFQFEKLRLSGFNRLIAERLKVSSPNTNNFPKIFLPKAELLLDWASLRHLDFALRGLRITGGRIEVPLTREGTVPPLLVTNIQTDLDFSKNDTWVLNHFEARVLGARATAVATISNVSSIHFPPPARRPSGPGDWQPALREAVTFLRQFEFGTPPAISLDLAADASHPKATRATLRADWRKLESQWGSIGRMRVTCSVAPGSNSVTGLFSMHVDSVKSREVNFSSLAAEGSTIWNPAMDNLLTNSCQISVSNLVTRWSRTDFASAEVSSQPAGRTNRIKTSLQISSAPIDLPGARTGTNLFVASFVHALPFQTPAFILKEILPGPGRTFPANTAEENGLVGEWRLDTPSLTLAHSRARNISATGEVRSLPAPFPSDASFGFWNYLLDYQIPWRLSAGNLFAGNMDVGTLQASGLWSAPVLKLDKLQARLYGGSMNASLRVDIRSRELLADVNSAFDYHRGALLLDKPVQNWLAQFGWEDSPEVKASIRVCLPPWNQDWSTQKKELIHSLTLSGSLDGSGNFRGVPADHVSTRFAFTNFVWSLPDLKVTRRGDSARFSYVGKVTNMDF
jgi:hypothetical protein